VNDLVKSVLTFLTAWMLILGCLLFLDRIVRSLENPELAALPEAPLGIIIGGLIAILTMAGQFVFQSESSRSTARVISAAADAAAKTALAPPSTTTISAPPVEVTTTTPPAEEDIP